MPVLKDPRYERFAQFLSDGLSVDSAADTAGLSLKPCMDLIGYYVYALVDPRNGAVFYIGKGNGKRHAEHWRKMLAGRVDNARKFLRLREIRSAGLRVREVCIDDDLSEAVAYRIERVLIRAVGFKILTNTIPGVGAKVERDYISGLNIVSRIKTFDVWLAERDRSQYDIQMYHWIKGALIENTERLGRAISL